MAAEGATVVVPPAADSEAEAEQEVDSFEDETQAWCPGPHGVMVRCTVTYERQMKVIKASVIKDFPHLEVCRNHSWSQFTLDDEFVKEGMERRVRNTLSSRIVLGKDLRNEPNSFAAPDGSWIPGVVVWLADDRTWQPCVVKGALPKVLDEPRRLGVELLGGAASAKYSKLAAKGVDANKVRPITDKRKPFAGLHNKTEAEREQEDEAAAATSRSLTAGPSPNLGPMEVMDLDAETTGVLLHNATAMGFQRDLQAVWHLVASKQQGVREKQGQIAATTRAAMVSLVEDLQTGKGSMEMPARVAREAAEAAFIAVLHFTGFDYYFADLATAGINSIDRLRLANIRMVASAIAERHGKVAGVDACLIKSLCLDSNTIMAAKKQAQTFGAIFAYDFPPSLTVLAPFEGCLVCAEAPFDHMVEVAAAVVIFETWTQRDILVAAGGGGIWQEWDENESRLLYVLLEEMANFDEERWCTGNVEFASVSTAGGQPVFNPTALSGVWLDMMMRLRSSAQARASILASEAPEAGCFTVTAEYKDGSVCGPMEEQGRQWIADGAAALNGCEFVVWAQQLIVAEVYWSSFSEAMTHGTMVIAPGHVARVIDLTHGLYFMGALEGVRVEVQFLLNTIDGSSDSGEEIDEDGYPALDADGSRRSEGYSLIDDMAEEEGDDGLDEGEVSEEPTEEDREFADDFDPSQGPQLGVRPLSAAEELSAVSDAALDAENDCEIVRDGLAGTIVPNGQRRVQNRVIVPVAVRLEDMPNESDHSDEDAAVATEESQSRIDSFFKKAKAA